MGKMGKCRSIGGEEKAEWEVSFIQGHGIRRVWGQIQSSLAPTLYPNDTRKTACAALCTFTPSLSSFPEPSTFSRQHLLFMAPQPGPLWSPHPLTPGEGGPCPATFAAAGGVCVWGGETEVGNPICLCSFYFLPPCFFHLPTSETPNPSLKHPPD